MIVSRVRKSVAHRIAAAALVVAGLVAGSGVLAQPAAAVSFPNTVTSSTGAYLQSAGICGGNFNFTVRSQGFEYVRILTIQDGVTKSGPWTAVAQNFSYTYNLPYGYQYKVYVVQGADWVNGRYEYRAVATSFDRITNGDFYNTPFC